MDIVIPFHPKDFGTIEECLLSIKKYVKKYNNIYIVSHKDHNFAGTKWINLDNFPFNGDSVIKKHGKTKKNGWYLQQLIKLYAVLCIPNATSTIVVIDSDIIFCNDIYLYDDDVNLPNLNIQYDVIKGKAQCHQPYFHHMKKLHPSLKRMHTNITGINQVFPIKKNIILDLFKMVEDYHNNKYKFWELFLMLSDGNASDASEFEILMNYILAYKIKEYKFIKWIFGLGKINKKNVLITEENINFFKNKNWKYIQFQSHMRGIRHHNYKDICIKCGDKINENHICDEKNTNFREANNIL